MTRYLTRVFAFLLIAVGVAACRTSPVYNVENAQFISEAQSLEQADKAIKAAGAGLGWQMKTTKPGHIVATLPIRSHLAVVDITYDRTQYNIRYKDSNNLKYDGTNIHSNYNGWIQNLQAAITAQSTTF